MCQAVRDGGRRCPIHQHQNVAFIKAGASLSTLTRYQSERLFAELRREGRNADSTSYEDRWNSVSALVSTVEAKEDAGLLADVKDQLAKSETHEEEMDAASHYAQQVFLERAKTRGEKVNARFQQVADRTGFSTTEIAEKFEQFYANVDTSRGADVPAEYNQNTRRAAILAGLPYDRSSVVAWEKLNKLGEAGTERRVTLHPVNSTSMEAAGYDDGRLEVKIGNTIHAYRDVPEGTWERLRTAARPGSIYARQVRNNPDFQYDTQDAAEADAYAVRCASCGQFRAASHACPEREVRAEIAETGAPTAEIVSAVEEVQAQAPVVEEVVVEETVTEPEIPTAPAFEVEEESEETAVEPTQEEAIVVAAPHIEAVSVSVIDPSNFTPITNNPPGFIGYPEPETPINYSPTVENQLEPKRVDSDNLVISGESGFSSAWLASQEDTLDSYGEEMAPVREELRRLPLDSNLGVLAVQMPGEEDYVIAATYDRRTHVADSRYRYDHETGEYGYSYDIKRKGTAAPDLSFTTAEAQAEREAWFNKTQALLDSGEAVQIPRNATLTRRYTFDANRSEQPQLNVGSATAFKRAIRDNKVALLPIEMKITGGIYGDYVDDQGYLLTARSGTTVTGSVAVRKNAEGVMETITNERNLRCNCRDYQRKYYCQHINYAHRHIANVAQQMLPTRAANRAPVDPDRHALMSQALINRGDVTVITGVDGAEDSLSFGDSINIYNAKKAYASDLRDRYKMPERLLPADRANPTPDELREMLEYNKVITGIRMVYMPKSGSQIRAAVKRSDVQVPMKASFNYLQDNASVTGNIVYEKETTGDLEQLAVKTRNLKCTCEDYQENYDCRHVRVVVDQAFAAINVGARDATAEVNNYSHVVHSYSEQFAHERELSMFLDRGATREEAEVQLAEYHAAAEARRLEEEERQRIREEEYRRERRAADEERAARRAAQLAIEVERRRTLNVDTIANAETYRAGMLARWETPEEGYISNPESFYDDFKEALSRKRAGGEAIEFKTENVTDGICADTPGARQFGVELEFDIKPDVNRSAALRKIGQELHEAGLTENAHQTGYHSARASGWGSWSFEEDCTVDAELVSPIMKDTPEHWEQLRKATEIITRNGGIATTRTGSHVHVSTASYESSSAKHVELLRAVNQNDDVLYRLASNPATGKHRGTRWCKPNVTDMNDDVSPEVADNQLVLGYENNSHGVALNFEGTANGEYKKSNIEFRMWDGTLDPAVIQQQISISAAMTDYAERNVINNGGTSKKPEESRVTIGTNRAVEQAAMNGSRTHTKESFEATSGQVASFFDKIFRTKAQRKGAASLFAVTSWQDSSAANNSGSSW